MKERLKRQLQPDAHRALDLARRFTGKEPLLKRVLNLHLDTRARLVRPKFPNRPYEIVYAKGDERPERFAIVAPPHV